MCANELPNVTQFTDLSIHMVHY